MPPSEAKRTLEDADSEDLKRAIQFLNTLPVEALWNAAQERIKAKLTPPPRFKVIQGGKQP